MELTKEQKIECLKYVLKNVIREKHVGSSCSGMCFFLKIKIRKIKKSSVINFSQLGYFIPEFKNKNIGTDKYWYDKDDFDSRMNFLKDLIKKIENGIK